MKWIKIFELFDNDYYQEVGLQYWRYIYNLDDVNISSTQLDILNSLCVDRKCDLIHDIKGVIIITPRNYNKRFFIKSLEDDYFIVTIAPNVIGVNPETIFKCDQFYGLTQCLKDNL